MHVMQARSGVAATDKSSAHSDFARRRSRDLKWAVACIAAAAFGLMAPRPTFDTFLLQSREVPSGDRGGGDFAPARIQSLGFFDDVPSADWALARDRIRDEQSYRHPDPRKSLLVNRAWYVVNYDPNFACLHERKVGGMGAGGGSGWVCDPHRISRSTVPDRKERGMNGCLVYSLVAGSSGEEDGFGFETDVLASVSPDCEIHVFGASDGGVRQSGLPPGIVLHPWGIKSSSDSTSTDRDGNPVKSLQETITLLGHNGHVVDIFKVSCEGCEWDIFRDWFDADLTLNQVLVDVHSMPDVAVEFFDTFREKNFVTFHKEGDLSRCGDWVVSYSFLQMSEAFFTPEILSASEAKRGKRRDLGVFGLAQQQSFGFFDNVAEGDWELLRQRMQDKGKYLAQNPRDWKRNPSEWYMVNYEPNFSCRHERRIGGLGDGAKWACDPHRIPEHVEARRQSGENGCLVYSFGSAGNFKFEDGVRSTIMKDCEVHIFDIDDYTEQTPEGFHFHQWGLGQPDADPVMKSLKEIVSLLGHEGRTIDLFKADCEHCEWNTFREWFDSGVTLNQILVEVHRRSNISVDFFEFLQENGYVTFHKEGNLMGDCSNVEYSFLRLNPTFFSP